MPQPATPDTQELLERSVRGDATARQELLVCHRARLRRMVALRLDRRRGARIDPSDVVQEALADAAGHLDDYLRHRPLPFYPWLRQFAWERLCKLHRHHIHARRRSIIREESNMPLPDESVRQLAHRLLACGTSPSRRLILQEQREQVRAALAELPPQDREVLVMRQLEQMETGEVAAALGISEAAVAEPPVPGPHETAHPAGGRRPVNTVTPPPAVKTPADSGLAGLVDEVIRRFQSGESIDPDALAGHDPERAEHLRRLLPTLEKLADLGCSATAERAGGPPAPSEPGPGLGVLGDYQLLREVGRGGMGIVYEAVQLSLHRRVALKVLPFAAITDPKQLQRFHVEAQAAAQLHHTHIVPVHAVGCERGVHYYAMQFIEGETLASVIDELRHIDGRGADAASPAKDMAFELASGLASGPLTATEPRPDAGEPTASHDSAASPPPASRASAPMPLPSSGTSTRRRAFFRNAARLGIQAAEAIEHAHQQGVLHRDIKPSNLLLDARGELWVTDFGLARLQGEASLTMTGDLMGTLRYMSPEQALAKRVVIDHRTDIYSLGATLYELLTLRPVFAGDDRQELLRQIAFAEPRPLRKLNAAVPRELETIVLKALTKDPAGRYATAQDLAEDLQRYLEDKPIKARRPSLWDRTAKFVRRHTAVVYSALLLLVLAVAGLSAGIVLIGHERDRAVRVAEDLRWQDYIHRVNLAYHEWEAHNLSLADRLLDDCPQEHRGFEWRFVRRLCHLDERTDRNAELVHALAFSPNGIIASGGGTYEGIDHTASNGELVIRDAETGAERFARHDLPTDILGLAFSPRGDLLASVGLQQRPKRQGVVTLWDPKTGEELDHQLEDGTKVMRAWCVAFSPDGRHVAVGYLSDTWEDPGYVKVWEVSGRALKPDPVLLPQPDVVFGVAFSPDGRLAVVRGASVQVFRAEGPGWSPGPTLPSAETDFAVACHPKDKLIAVGGWDRVIRLWDPDTGAVRSLAGHEGFVRALSFNHDGSRLASAAEDGTVRLWDTDKGRLQATFRGHRTHVRAVAFHPDGRRLASGGFDRLVKTWDAETSRPIVLETGTWVGDLAFVREGSGLVTSPSWSHGRDLAVKLWDPNTGRRFGRYPASSRVDWFVSLGPDERTLRLIGLDDYFRVVDASDGHEVAKEHLPGAASVGSIEDWPVIRPDRRECALEQRDGSIILVDMETGREIRSFQAHSTPASACAYSADGGRLATASALLDPITGQLRPGGEVKLWDLKTGLEIRTLRHNANVFQVMAFSRDGRRIALAEKEKGDFTNQVAVFVWDVETGQDLFTLRGHSARVMALAFSPDDRRLATSSRDRTVKLWDMATGEEVLTLRGHTAGVECLAWSPDGLRLVSGSIDWTARVWDATPLKAEAPQGAEPAPANERP